MTDFLIAGGGLAGACTALWLADHGEVTLLEAEQPAAGASGAAAGLVNPLMGRKANPAWRADDGLDALVATLELAGRPDLFRADGLLRPAHDSKQAETFRERAAALPHHADWLAPAALAERFPDLNAPHGGLWVRRGGSVDIASAVEVLLSAAEARGASVRTGIRVTRWSEDGERAWVETTEGERVEAGMVLLTLGDGFRRFPEFAALPLHRVKGQTIRLALPGGLGDLPALSGFGYVVPDGDTLVVGSTYEHAFDDVEPTEAASFKLRTQAARMVPALADAAVLEARAGVRVTVPGAVSPQRLPLVGPLPGRRRAWLFTGLGSKGLLTAPLLARDLPTFLHDPERIPAPVRLPG